MFQLLIYVLEEVKKLRAQFNALTTTLYQQIAAVKALIPSSGSGTQQVYQYNVDPTVEGILPTNQNLPAIAYQQSGLGDTYTWNTTTHLWQ